MAYTQTTLAAFTSDIAAGLSDPSNVYWSTTEIQYAIKEALLLWGALTSRWVERSNFTVTAQQPFYNLNTQFPALRARTYTYNQLCAEIQYHLLETANGSSGSGMTEQFSISVILSELLECRNQLALALKLPFTFGAQALTTPPSAGVVDLSQTIALLQRVAWTPVSGLISRLRTSDIYEAQAATPSWLLTPGTPYAYSQASLPPTQLQLIPPPLDIGTLHLIYVESQSSTASTLSFPDDLVHAVKYSTLESVLSIPGAGYDPVRARYCNLRTSQYLSLAPLRSLISVQVNGTPYSLCTIDDLDATSPSWQSLYGRPTQPAAAYDLLALSKVPDSAAYSITCDLVRSAPLPSSTSDYLQVGREELTYLYDYCRHVLTLKLGGSEFLSTLPLYDNFLSGAAKRNRLLEQKARYLTPLFDQPDKQEKQTPAT